MKRQSGSFSFLRSTVGIHGDTLVGAVRWSQAERGHDAGRASRDPPMACWVGQCASTTGLILDPSVISLLLS